MASNRESQADESTAWRSRNPLSIAGGHLVLRRVSFEKDTPRPSAAQKPLS
jgi:hypothetical protein